MRHGGLSGRMAGSSRWEDTEWVDVVVADIMNRFKSLLVQGGLIAL